MAQVDDIVKLIRGFKVFRDFGNGTFDICDADGNCLKVSENEIYLLNKTITMKAMKDAVLKVATDLANANNTVTTLELKTELRRDYPYYYWDQKAVSTFMDQLAGDGVFTYTDNGTYRIYSLTNQTGRVPAANLTKTVKAGPNTANTVSQTVTGLVPQKSKVGWSKVLTLAVHPKFEGVVLVNGSFISKSNIKAQKKSAVGYISPKQGRIESIVVGKAQYLVK